jgi:hypothetical protein
MRLIEFGFSPETSNLGFRNQLLVMKGDYVINTPASGSQEVRHLGRLVSELAAGLRTLPNVRRKLSPVAGSVDSSYAIYKSNISALTSRNFQKSPLESTCGAGRIRCRKVLAGKTFSRAEGVKRRGRDEHEVLRPDLPMERRCARPGAV